MIFLLDLMLFYKFLSINDILYCFYKIVVEHKDKNQGIDEEIKFGKFTLVDLAGSERAAASSNKGK